MLADDLHRFAIDILAVAQAEHLQLRGAHHQAFKEEMLLIKRIGLVLGGSIERDIAPQ